MNSDRNEVNLDYLFQTNQLSIQGLGMTNNEYQRTNQSHSNSNDDD